MDLKDQSTPVFNSLSLSEYGQISIKRQLLLNEKQELEDQCIIQNCTTKYNKIKDVPPKSPEKTHWDYVMAEMKWLATDFEDERKYKSQRIKKIVKAIQLYKKEQEKLEEKREEEILKEKKSKAKFVTKHVKLYWDKIDKIVTYKHKSQLYERRGELMDRHLQFMLKQTEDYTSRISTQLPEIDDKHLSETPFLFTPGVTLRPYQLKGLDWLISLYEQGLSGILADEMGLGKTIETISLLAYLAETKGIWGPHLIIVPTSTILNWECEFKRFCPAFKILSYYGTLNERKEKRKGWTNPNSYHVCITSYQLAIKDVALFRRRRWVYMILDEAHNIKNFKSTRWQTLLHFNTKRRLLLTGTPLQNSLMELWSLMHFLMPALFRSRGEFAFWFSNPLNTMVEGDTSINSQLILRLHSVLRPFILRRMKNEVEKEMPKKYFHILYCPLSKRQKYLYEDYISRRDTKDMLSSGSFLSMMSVLMQLRKVCNHPDLFETRPIESPFVMKPITLPFPKLVMNCVLPEISLKRYNSFADDLTDERLEENDWRRNLEFLPLRTRCINLFAHLPTIVEREYYSSFEAQLIQQLEPSQDHFNQHCYRDCNCITKEYCQSKSTYFNNINNVLDINSMPICLDYYFQYYDIYLHTKQAVHIQDRYQQMYINNHFSCDCTPVYGSKLRELLTIYYRPSMYTTQYIPIHEGINEWECNTVTLCKLCPTLSEVETNMMNIVHQCICYVHPAYCQYSPSISTDMNHSSMIEYIDIDHQFDQQWEDYRLLPENHMVYAMNVLKNLPRSDPKSLFYTQCTALIDEQIDITKEIQTKKNRNELKETLIPFSNNQCIYTWNHQKLISFPDKHLIEYDCGKFQMLNDLLPTLHKNGSRCLIFTQMSKMLDILEVYLNNHSYTYLRMDGSTNIDKRQRMMEQFNTDNRIFIFILSTRSGGLGINLIGANTVIFYDSDWNPSMDSQAQDRAHRIGQTRDVHIYRLISESTIEENILKKANQKRYLNQLSLEEGQFTTNNFFKEFTINDIIGLPPEENYDANSKPLDSKHSTLSSLSGNENIESIMNKVEDADDVQAAAEATHEALTIKQQEQYDTQEVNERDDESVLSGISVSPSIKTENTDISRTPKTPESQDMNMNTTNIKTTPIPDEVSIKIEKERKERLILEEQSYEREQARIKTELKTWAGKNADFLKELEKKLPTVQQKCIELRELYDPIPEVTPEALKAELDGLEEEEEIWEEEQKDSMELAELEVRDKDNTPTCLECTGFEDVDMNKSLFFDYRKEANEKNNYLIDSKEE